MLKLYLRNELRMYANSGTTYLDEVEFIGKIMRVSHCF